MIFMLIMSNNDFYGNYQEYSALKCDIIIIYKNHNNKVLTKTFDL